MKRLKFLSIIIICVLLLFSAFGGIEAYAVSILKPSVTLSNTSATAVKVSWNKVKNAKNYTVYRSTKKSSGYKAIKTTTSSSFSSTGLTCGKTYYFKVKAVNGKSSATSSVKSIKAKPTQVKSLKAEKGCTFIKLTWSKSSGASGYEVYSSTSKSGTYKKLKDVTSASYKNTGLKINSAKYYKVRTYKKVSGKKIYGNYSAILTTKTTSHAPASSWVIAQSATCGATGIKTNTCKYCGKALSQSIESSGGHTYVEFSMSSDKENCPYSKYVCSVCGDEYNTEIEEHKFSKNVIPATCTQQGVESYRCLNCGYSYEEKLARIAHNYKEIFISATCTEPPKSAMKCATCGKYYNDLGFTPVENGKPLGHTITTKNNKTEEGYIVPVCDMCKEKIIEQTDYTCYINLTKLSISVSAAAKFNDTCDKLELTPTEKTTVYEITGSAEELTIEVNAVTDVEIMLNNASIKNSSQNCFEVINKQSGASSVSIFAMDKTRNILNTINSGNAVNCSCNLTFKGSGDINMNTASTAIDSVGNVEIGDLNLIVNSKGCGIEANNIIIKPNAMIEIMSADYGIRANNMEIIALEKDDVDSELLIESDSSGIQLNGEDGISVKSGLLTIVAEEYAFDCQENLINFENDALKRNCFGKLGFSYSKH